MTHLFESNGNLCCRILSRFLAWDLRMQSLTVLWSQLGYRKMGVDRVVKRFWVRRWWDSVSKVILFINIQSNSPHRSVNLHNDQWFYKYLTGNFFYLFCKLDTVHSLRPPTHRRPLAWSQSIFMTKRWEKVLIMERCRESTSLLLLGVGGRDARVISPQFVPN